MAKSEDTGVRRALLEVLSALVDTCGPACGRHADRLLLAALHLRVPERAAYTAASGVPPSSGGPVPSPPQPHQQQLLAGAAGGPVDVASAAEGLMARLAEEAGCGGGTDELLATHRGHLVTLVDPACGGSMLLDTGVLCRLLLPHAAQCGLMHAPEAAAAAARVLPATSAAAGGAEDDEDVGSSSCCWLPESTAPVLRRLQVRADAQHRPSPRRRTGRGGPGWGVGE